MRVIGAQGAEGIEIRRARGPNFRVITLNGTSPVLSDVDVRQALAKAIDRQVIADTFDRPARCTEPSRW
jgi:peptide/nickel transport system substrate-binding protein